MDFILANLARAWASVVLTFQHNWWILLLSASVAAALKLYVNQNKIAAFLKRHEKGGILGATAAAVLTPLCSCGTMAVILGMMTSYISWGPVVAFMVASPLSSPQELLYSASLFGWRFAWVFFIASIVIGLGGGFVASAFERRGWLKNQSRFADASATPATAAAEVAAAPACACSATPASPACSCSVETTSTPNASCCGSSTAVRPIPTANSCGCSTAAAPVSAPSACGCGTASTEAAATTAIAAPATENRTLVELTRFGRELGRNALRLGAFFFGFAFIGYFLNGLIPASWVTTLFGSGRVYGVPLAATLGLPLYVNSEASLPLVRSLLDLGMSPGAAMAFLITGAGTSVGAIAGALTVAKGRVIAIVIGTLWVGAIIAGVIANLIL